VSTPRNGNRKCICGHFFAAHDFAPTTHCQIPNCNCPSPVQYKVLYAARVEEAFRQLVASERRG